MLEALFQWLRRRGIFIYIANMNVLVPGAGGAKGPTFRRPNERPLLAPPAGRRQPRLTVHLADHSDERPSRLLASGNQAAAESWKKTISDLNGKR